MRVLLQRVASASASVDGKITGKIDAGFLLLTGITAGDTAELASWMAVKVSNLRIFEDERGAMNRSALDRIEAGESTGALVVSQFTLYADCRKGRRPSFTAAAAPALAEPMVATFAGELAVQGLNVQQGLFGAEMQVSLVNDGPVTIWLDSEELGR